MTDANVKRERYQMELKDSPLNQFGKVNAPKPNYTKK